MRKKIGILFILILIIGLFGACKTDQSEPSATPSDVVPSDIPGTPMPSETPEPSEATSPSPAAGDAAVTEKAYEKNFEIDGVSDKITGELYLSVPEVTSNAYPENAARINEYFANLQAKYRENFETELYDLSDDDNVFGSSANRSLDVTFQTGYNHSGIISFYISESSYSGGAHDITLVKSETFDLSNGTRITADELFDANQTVYTKRIKEYILREMDKQMQEDEPPYFEGYADLVETTYDKNNFILTDEGLRVYFQVYDVAPYAAGSIQFVIPYSTLADILNPQYGIQ